MQYINIPAGATYPLVLGEDILAMNTAKVYLLCDTSSGVGAINILLPRITDGNNSLKNWWLEIFVNDIGNNASVNNIKITPNPADKINGSASQITLNTNGVTGRMVITGKTAWDFNVGSSSSGGGIDDSVLRVVSSTIVDFKIAGVTTLYTVPAGKQFYGAYVQVIGIDVTGVAITPAQTLGSNSPNYDNWGYNISNSQGTDLSVQYGFQQGAMKIFNSGEVIRLKINPDTATTDINRVELVGYFKPTP
jgi:hypothetical protein